MHNFLQGASAYEDSSFANVAKNLVTAILTAGAFGAASAIGDYTAKYFQQRTRKFMMEQELPPQPAVQITPGGLTTGSVVTSSSSYSQQPAQATYSPPLRQAPPQYEQSSLLNLYNR